MGFPICSNIFNYKSREHKYFSSFPVQVAVIFSPSDNKFVERFKELFLELDKITGKEVIFFAVLDPPEDWFDEAKKRWAWQKYWENVGPVGFSVNNRMLVCEIARLFGIPWGALPQIVVGTNLWTGEHITADTSQDLIESQLKSLCKLVRKWGRPNIGHLIEELEKVKSYSVNYHPPDERLIDRLNSTYQIFDTANNDFNRGEYIKILKNEIRLVDNNLKMIRDNKLNNHDWSDSNLEKKNSFVIQHGRFSRRHKR